MAMAALHAASRQDQATRYSLQCQQELSLENSRMPMLQAGRHAQGAGLFSSWWSEESVVVIHDGGGRDVGHV